MRAHPGYIVIAPLQIGIVMLHEKIHDLIGIFAAVKQVAHDVQRVHRQPLYDVRDCDDKILCAVQFDNGGENFVVIRLFVKVGAVHIDEFVDDIIEIAGQGFSHLASRIFGGDRLAHFQKPVKLHRVPFFEFCNALGFHLSDDRRGIIDEGRELVALALGHHLSVKRLYLFPDNARAVVHDMAERLVLAVHVAQKVLRCPSVGAGSRQG